MTRWRPVVAAGLAAGAALAAGCLRDTTGPGAHGRARFALTPTFAAVSPEVVAFDQIRVTVVRAPCAASDGGQPGPVGRTAVDTLVPFPAEIDSVDLAIVVPLEASREEFLVFVRLITAAGDTAYRTNPYPQCVVALAGGASAVLAPLLEYVGIGANAASVVINTVETLVSFGIALDLTATALDATGKPIPGTPIAWSSLDPTRVLVPDVGLGRVLGGTQRGPARIVARLPTGLADTVLITAQPLPSLLSIVSGNGQQALPGLPLPNPLRVRVTGPDGLGVQQVPVQFSALFTGASVADPVVLSDAAGYAQTQGVLGLVGGVTQTFEASVAGLPPVVFSALSLAPPIAPITQVLVTPTGTILDALFATIPFTAVARDSANNDVPTTFVWSSSDPNVAAVDPATGLARAVGNGVATITATAQGVTGTAQLDVFQRVAQLVFGTQPGNTIAGVPINTIVVRALDPGGSVAQNFGGPVTLFRSDGGTCPAILLGAAADAVQGVATFPNLIIQQACSGLQLSATTDIVTSPPSAPFSVLPGPATQLVYLVQPSGVPILTPISPPVQVAVQDQFGNLVTSWGSPVGIAILSGPLGGLLGGTLSSNPVGGIATFGGLTLNLPGLYTLVASSGGLPQATSNSFEIL